jgi:predicted Ser/Thr protein kinase
MLMYETQVPAPKKENEQDSLTEKNIQINTSIEDFFNGDKKYDAEYFDYLFERIEDLGLTEKRDALEDRLIQDVYDKKTRTLAQACQELEDLIEKRQKSIEYLRAGLSLNEKDPDVIMVRMNMVRDIDHSTMDQTLFLGSGNVARVYKLDNQPGLCVKKIYNDTAYATENSVSQEHDFMDDLSGFEVEGVRTPFVKETISGGGLTVIVMEELNAVNFELAATGKAPIPQDFDLEDFFQKLHTYITKMHDEKGIAHKDLAPRNVMICNKTGKPFVIDFGRSEYLANAKNADISREKDLAGLEASKALMRKFLTDKS